jgi:hypothetical protein
MSVHLSAFYISETVELTSVNFGTGSQRETLISEFNFRFVSVKHILLSGPESFLRS